MKDKIIDIMVKHYANCPDMDEIARALDLVMFFVEDLTHIHYKPAVKAEIYDEILYKLGQ